MIFFSMGEKFVNYVYETMCEFQVEANRTATADIENGVREMIQKISSDLKDTHPEFEIADVIPTGSFYEGTKIGAPDEFDFMLTLAKLSKSDKITLKPGCSVWYPHIKLQPGVEFPRKYMVNICYNGEYKDKDFLGNPKIIVLNFWKEITKVAVSMKESFFKLKLPQGTMSVELCESKKLQFFYKHKFDVPSELPDTKMEKGLMPVESFKLGVDLMLAIEHPSAESILELPGFPKDFKDLLLRCRCHIVPKSCHTDHNAHTKCWFVTFSCMERELMKNMDEHHKKCYKILKSLMSSEVTMGGKCMNLSSYTLKTAFLFHVYGETRCLNSRTLSACICDVLDYLSSNLYQTRMPCFFARDMNTWGNILETPWFVWEISETLRKSGCEFELCWIKLMYKYVNFLKSLISDNTTVHSRDWDTFIRKCQYFKSGVGNIMKHFSHRAFKLEGNQGTLESCSDEFYSDYIRNLKEYYKVDFYFLS